MYGVSTGLAMVLAWEIEGMDMKSWRDRQVERADAAYAAPFRARMKAKYREARTAADLLALVPECRKEQRYAAQQANKYNNFTRHGTHLYDSWSFLCDAAKDFGDQFEAKARRLDAGEAPEIVLPHLRAVAPVTAA